MKPPRCEVREDILQPGGTPLRASRGCGERVENGKNQSGGETQDGLPNVFVLTMCEGRAGNLLRLEPRASACPQHVNQGATRARRRGER